MSMPRKPLADILPGGGGDDDDIFDRFDATEAADEFGPLPAGKYVCVATAGGLAEARTGTRCYKLTFTVAEGDRAGRRLWVDKYLTPAALPYTKRDLAKLGIDDQAKLRRPFPAGRFVCRLTVAVRTLDDGTKVNEVKGFEVVRVQEPTADPFAPPADGDAAEPPAGDTDFPFGAVGGNG